MDTKARTKARNKAIGSNIARLRGQMSQSEVAKAMSERGHSWIQTTVSAVESGERALKLTEAVASGAHVKAVQRMLGHQSAAMTLDRYADLFDGDLDNVASALDTQVAASGARLVLPGQVA